MKTLTLGVLLLLTACGPTFTASETNEKGINPPATSGNSGTLASAGTGGLPVSEGGAQNVAGMAGLDNGSSGANSGGNPSLAGGPAMGQGGASPAQCLADWRACDSSACSNSEQTGCGEVIRCFVSHDSNSIDNCPGYTQTAYQLASEAERNCCK